MRGKLWGLTDNKANDPVEKFFHACKGTCSGWDSGKEEGRRELAKELLQDIEKLHSFDMGYSLEFGEAVKIGKRLVEKIKKEVIA